MLAYACPSRDELSGYIVGKLPGDRCEEIDSHLEGCLECQRSLETITNESITLLSGLQQRSEVGEYVYEPQCRDALSRLASLGSDSEPSSAVEEVRQQIGPYRLLAKLGQGGMGTVYKALHTKLDRVVALKLLPTDRMSSAAAVARFEREMKAVGKLDHPNIVRASDADEENGLHYLVMEYVEGIDLSELSRRVGPLPVAEACELVRQAAAGLQHAHEHGLVHRDIKPSNLMLRRAESLESSVQSQTENAAGTAGLVKILDLGLALLADNVDQAELTSSGQTMGTLDYMAPEQCGDSHTVDIRADVYSLGATLYKLLTGEPIFAGPNYQKPLQKFRALAVETAPPIQSRRADIPAPLATVVAKMVAREPRDRYATPQEVARALSPFCVNANPARLLAEPAEEAPRAGEVTDTTVPIRLSKPDVDTDRPLFRPLARLAPMLPGRRGPRIALLAGGSIATLLAAMVILWQTSRGTVQITIDDPDIQVRLDDRGATIAGVDKQHEIRVTPGAHDLTITRGDLTFTTNSFALKRGETTRLKIKLLPGQVQVLKDGNVICSKPIAAPAETIADSERRALLQTADTSFVPMFNQQDLSGWTIKRSATIDWKNENGTITARNRTGHLNSAGQLSSEKQYKNFHFRCEVLAGSGVEPILMFRGDDTLIKGKRRGYALIDPLPDSPVIAQGWGHGALYADDFQVPPHQSRLAPSLHKDLGLKTGDWYRLEFVARGETVEVRINGRTTATFTSSRPELNKAGSIALRCGAGARIAFRNLEIKDLSPPELATQTTAPARADDYGALAAGQWVPVLRDFNPKVAHRNARIEDGSIFVQDGHAYDSSIMAADLIVRAKVKRIKGQNVMLTLRDVLGVYYSAFYEFDEHESFGIGMRGPRFRYGVKQGFPGTAGVAEGEFFELAFSAVGDTLTVYVNGKQVGQIHDSVITRAGGVAVHTTKGQGVFKDVEVLVLDKAREGPSKE